MVRQWYVCCIRARELCIVMSRRASGCLDDAGLCVADDVCSLSSQYFNMS